MLEGRTRLNLQMTGHKTAMIRDLDGSLRFYFTSLTSGGLVEDPGQGRLYRGAHDEGGTPSGKLRGTARTHYLLYLDPGTFSGPIGLLNYPLSETKYILDVLNAHGPP